MPTQPVSPLATRLIVFAVAFANLAGCANGDSDETDEDLELDANMDDDEDVSPELFAYTVATEGHEPMQCAAGWTYYQKEIATFSWTDGITGDCHKDCKAGFLAFDEWTCYSCANPADNMKYCNDPVGTLQTTYYRGAPRPPICGPDEVLLTKTVWSAYAPPQEVPLCYMRTYGR